MDIFVVRHKPTGTYMPLMRPTGRGGSHWHPTPQQQKRPRLFYTKQAATNAISQWLRGEWKWTGWNGQDEEWDCKPVPVKSRKREDLEILMLEISGL